MRQTPNLTATGKARFHQEAVTQPLLLRQTTQVPGLTNSIQSPVCRRMFAIPAQSGSILEPESTERSK